MDVSACELEICDCILNSEIVKATGGPLHERLAVLFRGDRDLRGIADVLAHDKEVLQEKVREGAVVMAVASANAEMQTGTAQILLRHGSGGLKTYEIPLTV